MSEIKKSAKHGNFVIQQAENDSISIICDNTKQALRDIANEIGMEFDSDWNTQYFGHRLINFINGVDTTRKAKAETTEEVKKEFDEDNLISDVDWNWWVSLSDSLKYVLIKNLEFYFCDEVCEELPSWDEDDCLQSEVDLNDRSIMGNFVANSITGYYNEDGEFDYSETLEAILVPDNVFDLDDLDKLSHLKYLEKVSFYYNYLEFIPKGVGKLTQLKKLDLHRNELTVDGLEELATLTNLEELNLSENVLGGKAEDYEPLTKLTSLKTLNLSMNRIDSGAIGILDKIAKLTNLEKLDLSSNKFGEHDFAPLTNLVNLKELNLSYNEIGSEAVGILDKIAKLTNLETLNLESCKITITDDLLKSLFSLPNLRELYLAQNELPVEKFALIEELVNDRNNYISLSITGWSAEDEIKKGSEEYKKLEALFKEKGWRLS